MKKIVLVLCLIFSFVLSVPAQKIEVNEKGLFINKQKITKQTTMAVIDSLIGKPDRVSLLANTIWTYDNLGLFIYFANQDSFIKHVSFDLLKRDLQFSPAKPFKGSLVIHKNRITTVWSLARLQRIKALKFAEGVSLNPVAYTPNLRLFFEYDEAKKALRNVGVAL